MEPNLTSNNFNNFWRPIWETENEVNLQAFDTIVNNEIPLPKWLVTGKCVTIPKADNPQAKDHRPIALLNTLYKTVTSVIDSKLNIHQAHHQYMQIDQRGCTTGSMRCIDNLIIDKTTLKEV